MLSLLRHSLLILVLATSTLLAAETFMVDGRKAVIHPAAKPADGTPWLWYAPALRISRSSPN